MSKALSRLSFKGGRKFSKDELEAVALASCGDIRKAIQFLKFNYQSRSFEIPESLKEDEINLFRILGKILYNKSMILTDIRKSGT
jgi:hypothetical protein